MGKKRLYLELTENASEWKIPPVNNPVVYFCTGTPTIEYCEKYPVLSKTVNTDSVLAISRNITGQSAAIVFLSSNMVFDGTVPFQKENAPFSPLTEYGRQKADVEKGLGLLTGNRMIIRATKVFSKNMPLFKEWITALTNGKAIHPLEDKKLSPIPLQYLIKVLYLCSKNIFPWGVIQISGELDLTYADIAYRMAEYLGADRTLVKPISSKEIAIHPGLVRPFTTLQISPCLTRNGLKPPPVWETVDRMIAENIQSLKDSPV